MDLSGLNLTELPDSIGQLSELEELELQENRLNTLPESIGQLVRLGTLNIDDNQLIALPESMAQLKALTWLRADDNRFPTFPDVIPRLGQLRYLYVSGHGFTELPESIGQLTGLRWLYLRRNGIVNLPTSFELLTQLEWLMLSSNKLQTIPESIGSLTQLERLDLSSNELRTLPESIGSLTQLQVLELPRNQLRSLPESIGRMKQLRGLDVRENRLEMLPESIRGLDNLIILFLHENEKLGLPPELLGTYSSSGMLHLKFPRIRPISPVERQTRVAASEGILEYYFHVRTDSRPLNEAKLILIGRGAAGKTCTVNRLMKNRFNPHENKTEGIQINKWTLKLSSGEEVRLNIWDFGGQEIMHATHQFFLTQRSLYLVVLNGREGGEDADAEYWLKLIESFGGDSPVIIVLNKIKQHPFDLDRRGLRGKYKVISDFVVTDCEDGTGREELIQAIKRETGGLKHLGDAFPEAWFKIKDQLASMEENYLSFEQYQKICADLGERDSASQELLVSYLNSLGIVLNYKDDPRLKDMHVLNPHWVTKGIYAILNSAQLQKEKGEIHLKDIPGILKGKDYPSAMHRFLMDLMKKFDLCFSFPEDDTHYLIRNCWISKSLRSRRSSSRMSVSIFNTITRCCPKVYCRGSLLETH